MKFSLLSLAIMASVAVATQMQVRYYSDHKCHRAIRNSDVSWAQPFGINGVNCHNYHYGRSISVENCAFETCSCEFFYQEACRGDAATLNAFGAGADNCISDAQNFNSFRCFYYSAP